MKLIDAEEIEFLSRETLKEANPAAERFWFSVGLEAGAVPAKVDVPVTLLEAETIGSRKLSQAEWIELLREFLALKGEAGWDPTTEDTLAADADALAAARARLAWPA